MAEQEALVVELMEAVRNILMARLGRHALRVEGGSLIVTVGAEHASAWIPEITNVNLQARAIAKEIESLLTEDE
tara:strand:- start:2645 stop:2866 length:222 start_codon:yes stop_codon:yes gene_type:complete